MVCKAGPFCLAVGCSGKSHSFPFAFPFVLLPTLLSWYYGLAQQSQESDSLEERLMNPSPQRKTTKVVTGVLGISGWIGCPKPCKRSDPRMKVTGPLSKKRKLFGFLLNYEKTLFVKTERKEVYRTLFCCLLQHVNSSE